jgi:hypothetical protein
MKLMFSALLLAAAPAAAAEQVTIEHYYRIKWGSAAEFKKLYNANHAPILKEMQRQGFTTAMKLNEPFTHMAGDQRWDLRVTITYRDPPSAVLVGGPYDKAAAEVTKRLYPDEARLDAEESRRFSLVEEHWDVIVTSPDG